jgi:hypothetical protein
VAERRNQAKPDCVRASVQGFNTMALSDQLKRNIDAQPELGTICQLADHLDAVLAMGEDMVKQSVIVVPLASGDANDTIAARQHALTGFARALRALELGIMSRLIQARLRAMELRPVHPGFSALIGLFLGGTAAFADASTTDLNRLGDISVSALASGPDVLQFFISRNVVPDTVRSLGQVTELACTEQYLLAEQIQLGPLLDMIAQFLESLDLAFNLYIEPADVTAVSTPIAAVS